MQSYFIEKVFLGANYILGIIWCQKWCFYFASELCRSRQTFPRFGRAAMSIYIASVKLLQYIHDDYTDFGQPNHWIKKDTSLLWLRRNRFRLTDLHSRLSNLLLIIRSKLQIYAHDFQMYPAAIEIEIYRKGDLNLKKIKSLDKSLFGFVWVVGVASCCVKRRPCVERASNKVGQIQLVRNMYLDVDVWAPLVVKCKHKRQV